MLDGEGCLEGCPKFLVARKVASTNTLKHKMWVVQKSLLPELPEKWRSASIDAAILEEVPLGCCKEDAWFLDQLIPRTELPIGTMEWVTAVSAQRTLSMPRASLGQQPALPPPTDDAPATSAAAAEAAPASGQGKRI